MRLRLPDRRADLIRQVPGLRGHSQRLIVSIQTAKGDGLVDLQQQPQVGEGRIGLGHGQRPVEQRQRVGLATTHPGQDR